MSHEPDDSPTPSIPEQARKRARVRRMIDPLGAMGFRDTRQRYQRESRARRAIFGGAAASFIVGTALIVAANNQGTEGAPANDVVSTSVVEPTVSGQAIPATGQLSDQSQKARLVLGSATGGSQLSVPAISTNPPAVSSSSESKHESDDHHDDHDGDDHHDDHEGDDHHDDHDGDEDHRNVVVPTSQPATSSNNQTTIRSSVTITQPEPHTRTNSTGS